MFQFLQCYSMHIFMKNGRSLSIKLLPADCQKPNAWNWNEFLSHSKDFLKNLSLEDFYKNIQFTKIQLYLVILVFALYFFFFPATHLWIFCVIIGYSGEDKLDSVSQHKANTTNSRRVPGGGSLSDSRCSPSAASSKILFIKDTKIKMGNENEPISNDFPNISPICLKVKLFEFE